MTTATTTTSAKIVASVNLDDIRREIVNGADLAPGDLIGFGAGDPGPLHANGHDGVWLVQAVADGIDQASVEFGAKAIAHPGCRTVTLARLGGRTQIGVHPHATFVRILQVASGAGAKTGARA